MQTEVCHQLSEDEACDLQAGRDFSLDDAITPGVLITSGIDLETE